MDDATKDDFCLIAKERVRGRFARDVFADSHGAFDGVLGCGYLYYGFAAAVRAQVSVCVGSGAGFVPDLLAQAQKDLGLTPAATYLVDANLPDLGFGSPIQNGGWLRPDNDFLRRAAGVRVLQMLSSDAAALFFAQGIKVDYLHIDGDHSTDGVIADFENYAPLLSSRAVVSLHDLALPSVQAAMREILRRRPDWDCLELGEIGVGTAFMRRRAAAPVARMPESLGAFVDAGRRVDLDPDAMAAALAESRRKTRFERWSYLRAPAYRMRYAIAAEIVDAPGSCVVEIGGYPNSCIDFLSKAARLIAIEAYAPEEFVKELRAAARDKGVDLMISRGSVAQTDMAVENLGEFNLVWLGMDISADELASEAYQRELAACVRLVGRAARVVVEFSEHTPSALVWRLVETCLSPTILLDLKLDLTRDPAADAFYVKDGRARRRIIAFAPTPAEIGEHADKIERCAEALLVIQRRMDTAGRSDDEKGVHHYWAAELPANFGESDGVGRTACAEDDASGCFTFGPYVQLAPGAYVATISYVSSKGDAAGEAPEDSWDVCVGARSTIARGPLEPSAGEPAQATGRFEIAPGDAPQPVEIRTFFGGRGSLTVAAVAIHREAQGKGPSSAQNL